MQHQFHSFLIITEIPGFFVIAKEVQSKQTLLNKAQKQCTQLCLVLHFVYLFSDKAYIYNYAHMKGPLSLFLFCVWEKKQGKSGLAILYI